MIEQPEPDYRVPWPNKIARAFIKPLFCGIFHLLANIKITGHENIPFRQPYLAVINHVSTFDPPFFLALWPEMIEAMGASDIWKRPGQAQLVRLYHAIPVHRGEYDRVVFDRILSILASGRPLLLAPEGGRSHQEGMQRARPGVAYIVERAQVPVIPVGIVGTTDNFIKKAMRGERRLLEMRIGKPLVLPSLEGKGNERRESRQRNADLVMQHIAGLLPRSYRGVYTETAVEP